MSSTTCFFFFKKYENYQYFSGEKKALSRAMFLPIFLDEKETSEKESSKHKGPLSQKKWNRVFGLLQPYLRPYGESREGRLDFYHRALSKAVRKRFV